MHSRPAAIGLFAIQILSRAVKHKVHRRRMYEDLIPHLESTNDGHVKTLESFGDYVARQLGLKEGNTWCWLSKFANDYVRESRSDSNDSREEFFAYLTGLFSVDEIDSLYSELVREFEACMLSYFAFHWEHYLVIVDQVLDSNSHSKKRLRAAILSATRKQRFERVVRTLRTKNVFSTLVELLKAIGKCSPHSHENNEIDTANANERHPILLLVGGGMGAGKSSVIRDKLKDPIQSCVVEDAVVVEADAFKESDLIYKALSINGSQDMLETAEFVHKSSTDAASSLLVAALNGGRDVIFDGTMSWEPFVEQTIEMVRDIHRRRYRMGPGYQVDNDGHVHEKYWEPVKEYDLAPEAEGHNKSTKQSPLLEEATSAKESLLEYRESRKPYRIELIGVICDAPIAVFRGIRRALSTGRAVRIRDQLLSHKMFADAFYNYCELVDHVELYSTNNINGQAELIGMKNSHGKLEINHKGVNSLRNLSLLNPNARSVLELYTQHRERREPDKYWKDVVLSSERFSRQKNLQNEIERVEFLLSERVQNLQ
ncbi:calmodulin calcium-dependent NAD kinase isoform X2 [Cryptomeria japonica]|nr:calmodulin calcium-dependent NAD kinase isoform X2 [Cryptomeria japonica]